MTPPARSRSRRWPLIAMAALAALALLVIWSYDDLMRQARIVFTLLVVAVTTLVLFAWLLLFAGLRARVRLGLLAGALVLGAGAASLVRVHGVTGDFVPLLEWRFARAPASPALPVAAVEPPAPVGDASPDARPAAGGATPASTLPSDGVIPASPTPAPGLHPLNDWPQFLGPTRDATLPDVALDPDWSARPPRVVWRQTLGSAWSSFAVAQGVAVTQEQQADQERVVALDLASGRVRWAFGYSARYATVVAGEGPRATPAIADGRVFALGATGMLSALDLRSGRLLWQHDVARENAAPAPDWGRSGSPLVFDGRVIVSAGGPDGRSLLAYDAASGRELWAGGSAGVSYSSPVLLNFHGQPQVVSFNATSVSAHDPETGRVLWEQGFPGQQPNVSLPMALGSERLLVSAGYGIGSKLYQLARSAEGGWSVTLLWESPRLKSKFANLILHGGYVFGLDDGVLTCLDPADGTRRFKAGRYGHGQLLRLGARLLVQTEDGELVLLDATPDEPRERARWRVFEGKLWNPPAFVSPYLLMRNEREAVLLELPLLADTPK